MLDTIRNRTLNMALEIKGQMQGIEDRENMTMTDSDRISQSITNNIFNGPAYFASGAAQVHIGHSTNHVIAQGSREDLDNALLKSGLSEPDVQALTRAMRTDGGSVRSSIASWIAKVSPKLVSAGIATTQSVAQSLLTGWLNQYFGL